MKINGIEVSKPRLVKVHFYLEDGQAVEFAFRPLTRDDDYEKITPKPIPPEVVKPNNVRFRDFEDANYKSAMEAWATNSAHWKFLKSIGATEGLEWDKVKTDDPSTWPLWEKEIDELFGIGYSSKLFESYVDANMLSEEVMEEARKSFILSKAPKETE